MINDEEYDDIESFERKEDWVWNGEDEREHENY